MDHAPQEVGEVAAQNFGQFREFPGAQLVPVVAVFRQRPAARALERREAQGEDVGLRQVGVVLVEDFRAEVAAVALFDL